jgi:hypothetical protein
MGIGCVILVWLLAGMVMATIGAFILAFATRRLTKDAIGARKRTIVIAFIFPFFCFVWTGAVFAFQAYINESFLDRDAGIGDSWHCPLPNGYAITMIDVPDYGWVENERLYPHRAMHVEGEGSIAGVRLLQVSGAYILGAADSNWSSRVTDRKGDSNVSFYFLIDTQAGHRSDFSTQDEFRMAASKAGLSVDLKSINSVYIKYRYTWFDLLAVILEIVPILIFAVLFGQLILKLRRTRPSATGS